MPESADATSEWVDVYESATGRKQTVPAHFLDDPVLKVGFRKTPLSEKQQREADATLAAASIPDTPDTGDKE